MGYCVKADLAGCKIAFLVVKNGPMETSNIIAMDILKNYGVKQVKPIKGFDKAAALLAELQKSPQALNYNKFFKLRSNGEIVPAFSL